MESKELEVVKSFLEKMSDSLSNNCCNDWGFPGNWTIEEKKEFVKSYHEWNGDPEEYDHENLSLPDFAVCSFLASKIL